MEGGKMGDRGLGAGRVEVLGRNMGCSGAGDDLPSQQMRGSISFPLLNHLSC